MSLGIESTRLALTTLSSSAKTIVTVSKEGIGMVNIFQLLPVVNSLADLRLVLPRAQEELQDLDAHEIGELGEIALGTIGEIWDAAFPPSETSTHGVENFKKWLQSITAAVTRLDTLQRSGKFLEDADGNGIIDVVDLLGEVSKSYLAFLQAKPELADIQPDELPHIGEAVRELLSSVAATLLSNTNESTARLAA